MRISDWSSDVCSSDLDRGLLGDTPVQLGGPRPDLLRLSGPRDAELPPGAGAALSRQHLVRHLDRRPDGRAVHRTRSEEHTSELQSLMRISYAVFCLKKKKKNTQQRIIAILSIMMIISQYDY